VRILFDSTRADFGGLVVPRPDRPPPCPPLSSGVHLEACTRHRISEAAQHVFLDVDEKGTEAAAITSIGFGVRITSAPPPPIRFFVDRPFLFALRDEKTGTFLFVGFIADLRQKLSDRMAVRLARPVRRGVSLPAAPSLCWRYDPGHSGRF